MGNRAVITTRKNFENNGVGVYVHWNGGRDSVEAFLKYCELRNFRSPSQDCYGWARLVQVLGNFFGINGLFVGIDLVQNLDCDNFDNGVYIIEDWNIVGREYFEGDEQNEYDLYEMLKDIDDAQPEEQRLGEYMFAPEIPTSDLKVGDVVYVLNFNNVVQKVEILGFGEGVTATGTDVTGLPYAEICGGPLGRGNINNYIRTKTVRLVSRKPQ